jgi:hypothetical protein
MISCAAPLAAPAHSPMRPHHSSGAAL